MSRHDAAFRICGTCDQPYLAGEVARHRQTPEHQAMLGKGYWERMEERNAQIVAAKRQGQTVEQLARKTGLTRARISQILRRAGITRELHWIGQQYEWTECGVCGGKWYATFERHRRGQRHQRAERDYLATFGQLPPDPPRKLPAMRRQGMENA